jgi:hypothetical protein
MPRIAGRQVAVGIGIEATPDTAVAPTFYPMWTSYSIQGVADKSPHRGSRGTRNAYQDSYIRRKYSSGTVQAVASTRWASYAFALALGVVSPALASGESAVWAKTITPQENNAAMKTATVTGKNGSIVTDRFTNVVANTLSLEVSDDWALIGIDVLGGFPDTSSPTESFIDEYMFAYPDTTLRFGADLAAAAAASPLPVKAFNLSINNNIMIDEAFRSGSAEPISGGFTGGVREVTGSYTLAFENTTELNKYLANTRNALIVTMEGTDTIGVASKEKIVIRLGALSLTNAPKSYDQDGLVMITQEFTVETDATDGDISVIITDTEDGTDL